MELKEQILAGTRDLFMRYGIKSVTMDEIATHLSISKKTIYQHFPDKDTLVLGVVGLQMNDEICKWDQVYSTAKDSIEEMRLSTEVLRAMATKMNPSILFDMRKYHPLAWKAFQEHKSNHIYQNIKGSIERGKSQGYFRKDVNADIVAKLRLEEIDLAFNPDIYPPEQYTLVDVHVTLFEHFIYGISTLKGHTRMNELKQIND